MAKPKITVHATEPPSKIVTVKIDGKTVSTVNIPEPNQPFATRRYLYHPYSGIGDHGVRIASVRVKKGEPVTDADIELTDPDGLRKNQTW